MSGPKTSHFYMPIGEVGANVLADVVEQPGFKALMLEVMLGKI